MHKKQSDLSHTDERHEAEINEREKTIEKLKAEKEELRNWLFKQSSIYKKVEKLSEQKVSNKKELTVLSNKEQANLKETVWEIHSDYLSEMKELYPALTDEDLLYLCLDKAGFSNLAISLCFGNINTHALAQRKYRIREKMKEQQETEK